MGLISRILPWLSAGRAVPSHAAFHVQQELIRVGSSFVFLPQRMGVIMAVLSRPKVEKPTEYGNAASFWVEYPSGLVDLTRSRHLASKNVDPSDPALEVGQVEIPVEGGRSVRIDPAKSAFVIVDMQNYFLHPEIRDHPTGLACVDPLLSAVPALRQEGVKILWLNWGLTEHELTTIPPSLSRNFMKNGRGGFGSQLPGNWGRLLMRDESNSALYGPLQEQYLLGKEQGMDEWIHKNRMSGIWGHQTALDLYLEQQGITTLFFAGVNADQCVLGTLIDAYYRGYDIIAVRDGIATTSPAGGLENMMHNTGNSYGFITDSQKIVASLRSE